MATSQHSRPSPVDEVGTGAPSGGLDPRVLALASFSSVLGGILAAQFGGGTVASLVAAAVSPWVTAFLTHPGPRRVRRAVAVLLLAWLIGGCRKALAAVRTSARVRPAGTRVASSDARLARGWLGQVALSSVLSLVVAVASLTAVEAIRGQAFAADRDTTFFGGGSDGPETPKVHVPQGVVVDAGALRATRVTYAVTATDRAGNPLLPVCRPPSGSLFALGRTRVTCEARDTAGVRGRGEFVVTVRRGGAVAPRDGDEPTLTVPRSFTHDAPAARGGRVTYPASARDQRDGALTPSCLPASGSLFALGRTRVTCSATDAAGNIARASFVVTVVRAQARDRTRPVITVRAPQRTAATSRRGARVLYDVAVTDNRDGALEASCYPASGAVFEIGSTSVTCSARDRAANEATERFTITVVGAGPDKTPPTIAVPAAIETAATTADGATVTYEAIADDERDGALRPSCEPSSGSTFAIGTTTVRCTARDRAGNTAAKSFKVTIVKSGSGRADRRPPSIRVPGPIEKPATSARGAPVGYDVAASDDRDGTLVAGCKPSSGSIFPIRSTTVRCSAQDAAGNTARESFTVTVIDEPPKLVLPKPVTQQTSSQKGTDVTYVARALDVVDGELTPGCDPPSGAFFPVGTTDVTCRATDSNGGSVKDTFPVTVVWTGPG